MQYSRICCQIMCWTAVEEVKTAWTTWAFKSKLNVFAIVICYLQYITSPGASRLQRSKIKFVGIY